MGINPCKGCEDRYERCHSICKLYKHYEKEHARELERLREAKRNYSSFVAYKKDAIKRAKNV